MIRKTLKEVEELAGGEGLDESFSLLEIAGVSTDSRKLTRGNLFVPLVGDNFDGHEFITTAIENGALASFWQADRELPDLDFPFILVEDSLEALQTLAKNYRNSLEAIKIVAITGSNGKTSTKDIMEGILSTNYKTQKTQGNLNNHIGLPLTLLGLEEDSEVGIIEMGTDGFGQIQLLTNLARPDIAIITNIGDSHLDLLKNKDNVARAKLEILEGLQEDGLFIYNKDDQTLENVLGEYEINQEILTFGQDEMSDFQLELKEEGADGIHFTITQDGETHLLDLPLLGRHNMYNAACSIIVARKLAISYSDIQEGLYNIDSTEMRNELIKTGGFTILNDAYKSNPASLLAALDTLYSIDGYKHKALVLGDMLDLGEDIIDLHRDIGPRIDPSKVDQIFTTGDLGWHIGDGAKDNFDPRKIYHCDNKKDLVKSILDNLKEDTLILVKGSRGVALEDVIDELLES